MKKWIWDPNYWNLDEKETQSYVADLLSDRGLGNQAAMFEQPLEPVLDSRNAFMFSDEEKHHLMWESSFSINSSTLMASYQSPQKESDMDREEEPQFDDEGDEPPIELVEWSLILCPQAAVLSDKPNPSPPKDGRRMSSGWPAIKSQGQDLSPANVPLPVKRRPEKTGEAKGKSWTLPPGWTVIEKIRANGKNKGQKEKFYISPSGKKLRSTVEVDKYLQRRKEEYY